jgi:pimeloyl-ACP methyl ester carboxylesterase
MAAIHANGITIEYETTGEPDGDPVLLIMGFGLQLVYWPDDLCNLLAEDGYRVIRFDHRDVGLSTRLDGVAPTAVEELRAVQRGEAAAPYTLDDMADDAAGLLDALGVSVAHVVGASMGARIGRKLALRHPRLVRSLALMIARSPSEGLPPPQPEAQAAMAASLTIDERDAWIEYQATGWRVLTGGHGTYDEEHVRRTAERHFDRGFYRQGLLRQQAAVAASYGSDREELLQLQVPTLVIQGSHDPMNSVEHGRDLADLIPGAELVIIENLGHEFPPHACGPLAEAIAAHAKKASSAPAGA